MNTTFLIILGIIIFVVPLIVISVQSRKTTYPRIGSLEDFTESKYVDPLVNREIKPTIKSITRTSKENFKSLLIFLNKEFEKFGGSDFIWRGDSKGWVLTIKESYGSYGFIILIGNKLTGYIVLTQFNFISVLKDKELPSLFVPKNLPKPLLDNDMKTLFGYLPTYVEFEGLEVRFEAEYYHLSLLIDNLDKCKAFIKLLELSIKYYDDVMYR